MGTPRKAGRRPIITSGRALPRHPPPAPSPVAELRIEHSSADGTTIEGTTRGDGTGPVLKANGWRWSWRIEFWYLPNTRDRGPKRDVIERTADALRAAGHTVETDIDPTPRDTDAIEAAYATRASERAQRYADHAERHQVASEAARARADRLSARFAGGQPILIGHHSQRSAERDQQRMHQQMHKAIDESDAARAAAARAKGAAAAVAHRQNPVTVANRIARLSAEIRKFDRSITAAEKDGRDVPRLREERARRQTALDHWKDVRREQVNTGTVTPYGPHNVHKGDAVRIGHHWRRVARVNAKSVTVETEWSWTDRAPWHTVQDHRPGTAR